jgi:hypothetical protein
MGKPADNHPQQPPRRRKRRPQAIALPIIDATAMPQNLEDKSFFERLRDGGPGLLFSLLVHSIILAILAWFTYRIIGPAAIDTIDVSWGSATKAENKSLIPVRISAFTSSAERPARRKPREGADKGIQKSKDKPQRAVQPVNVDDLLKDRNPRMATQRVLAHGGDERTMRTIGLALGWFKRQQQSAGHWKLHEGYPNPGLSVIRTDTGATALALLPFLGAGHSPTNGEHHKVVARGIQWLVGIQKADGNFHDHDELGRQTAFYAHAQATIVMCEAYAMSGDASLREPAERAVGFLLSSQQPKTGGWKYRPLDADSTADLSVTGWALMALHSARSAGIEVPDEPFQRASSFLDSVSEQDGERYKYEPTDPPSRVSIAMTAEGILCRQFLGATSSDTAIENGIKFLLADNNRPQWSAGRRNVYEWYYVGHVLHNTGGSRFTDWYSAVAHSIVDNQAKSGTTRRGKDVRGSWHPEKPIGSPHEYAQKAGRLYLTSLSTLILELPFRYQPIVVQ